jgi:two-component system, chemotaxis family, chemotaxis protein CheY
MTQSALIDLSNTSVLCMDDDAVIRSVVRHALQQHGCHDVVVAHGGSEALDLCSGRRFDLLICDYQMSPMNGLAFLRELARLGLGEGWPVIMLSAETDPATIQEAQELGVRAWVGKPVSLQVLIDNVGTVLHRTGQITRSGQDPERKAMLEQHHARLMATLRMAEEANQGLQLRPREIVLLVQALRHALDDANELARILDYGLITMLIARATDLVVAMVNNPGAAARGHVAVSRVLGTLITAMKRVAQNRMEGDGAVAGLKLLEMIDGLSAPVRAGLG